MVYEPLLKIAEGQHTWLPLWPRWALCNYIHLVLTAKRSLFDCQHLIIPRDTRGEPRATAASSGTIFLQRTAPSSGFPERLGSLPLPHSPHPPPKGRASWGTQPYSGLSFLHSQLREPSHTVLRMPVRCWHLQLISCGLISCRGSGSHANHIGTGVKVLYGGANTRQRECTVSANLPLSGFMFRPLRMTPSVPVMKSEPYFPGRKCRSLIIAVDASCSQTALSGWPVSFFKASESVTKARQPHSPYNDQSHSLPRPIPHSGVELLQMPPLPFRRGTSSQAGPGEGLSIGMHGHRRSPPT